MQIGRSLFPPPPSADYALLTHFAAYVDAIAICRTWTNTDRIIDGLNTVNYYGAAVSTLSSAIVNHDIVS